MLQKTYIIENLDCANCAAKIERKFNALAQVEEAVIVFPTKQLRLTAADPDSLLEQLTAIARTVESGVEIHPQEHSHHDHHPEGSHSAGCCCGHHSQHHDCCHHHRDHCHENHHHHDHSHEHSPHDAGHEHSQHDHTHDQGDSYLPLLLGGGCFLAALVLGGLGVSFGAAVFYIGAYLILGLPILGTAARNLIKGHIFDENFLMSIATIGAFLIGEFPEAAGVMLFYRLGTFFEHKAVERSRGQIMEAVDLRPETVNRILGDVQETIPAEAARVGDILLVRPGDRIPLDGVVISGESRLDTAPITGEPVPVSVGTGDPVTSGCVNTVGMLTIRVEKPLADSMVTRILNSVENAAANKPKIDRFITRFSRIYTPIVVGLAALTAVVPSLVTGDWSYWVYTALSFLVMSCPCALVLSVPLAFFSGIGVAGKQGILFKGGASMEAMAQVKAVAMDKTGTVTKGDFAVQEITGGGELLSLCAGCEQYSTHPIALSILAAARAQNLSLPTPEKVDELSGRGIRAVVDGKTILCGNQKLMAEHGVPVQDEAGTVVYVAVEGEYAGAIRIADTIKPHGDAAVKRLQDMGISVSMLTGDSAESANAVASATGIPTVFAKLLPQEKLEVLQTLRARHGATMFVGDGINDAPVLAGADVGAAMGSGADAAIEAADVVYMTSDIGAIPDSLGIARQTKAIAWQNVVFALAVKAAVMVLGLLGYASMWMAVFADSGVAMLCVLNAIRLLYRKR